MEKTKLSRVCVLVKDIPSRTRHHKEANLRDHVDGSMSGVDVFAVAAAANLSEEVVAVTMGPPEASGSLREAMSLGAHKAVRITDNALEGADATTTAKVLSAAVSHLVPEAVLIGRESTDGRMGVLGGMLAEHLDWPFISGADQITVAGSNLRVRVREGHESVHCETKAPFVLSVAEYGATPQEITLEKLKHAFLTPIENWTLKDLDLESYFHTPSRHVIVSTEAIHTPRKREVIQGAEALPAFFKELAIVKEGSK